MEKLTLEHLAPYLPYGLRVQLTNDQSEDFDELIDIISDKDAFREGAIWNLIGYADGNFSIPMGEGEIDGFILGRKYTYCSLHPREFKPILRPLSDLTKDIEHNGERFVPMDFFEIGDDESNNWFEFHYGNIRLINHLTSIATHLLTHDINYLPHAVVVKLYEWHFDVFGLIAAGIAVDINTLEGGSSNGN